MEISEGTIWECGSSEVEDTLWKRVCAMAEVAVDGTRNQ